MLESFFLFLCFLFFLKKYFRAAAYARTNLNVAIPAHLLTAQATTDLNTERGSRTKTGSTYYKTSERRAPRKVWINPFLRSGGGAGMYGIRRWLDRVGLFYGVETAIDCPLC